MAEKIICTHKRVLKVWQKQFNFRDSSKDKTGEFVRRNNHSKW